MRFFNDANEMSSSSSFIKLRSEILYAPKCSHVFSTEIALILPSSFGFDTELVAQFNNACTNCSLN